MDLRLDFPTRARDVFVPTATVEAGGRKAVLGPLTVGRLALLHSIETPLIYDRPRLGRGVGWLASAYVCARDADEMRLLDLLAESGRAKELREYTAMMDRMDHSYRTDFYLGRAAQIEGDLNAAFQCWNHMTEEYPDEWCAWSLLGDALAYACRYDEAMSCYQKSMDIQEKPRYMDNPVAMAQIAEIQGDYEKAIRMREICIEMNRTDWNQTEGEWVDIHRREIERLRSKMKQA